VVASDLDGVILVGGPTRLPVIRQAVREYFQQEPKSDVDPDRAVAMGAAIHAASLATASHDAYLLDVTPLSLRLGVAGGLAETVIERNTPVPIEQTRTFTTFQDFQESVNIRVYQGESREAQQNELLGQFEFSGFARAPRGKVAIDVTFEINADGIVNVTAADRATGQQASTRITLSSGLSEGEIQTILDTGRTDRLHTTEEMGEAAPSPARHVAAPPDAEPADDELLAIDDPVEHAVRGPAPRPVPPAPREPVRVGREAAGLDDLMLDDGPSDLLPDDEIELTDLSLAADTSPDGLDDVSSGAFDDGAVTDVSHEERESLFDCSAEDLAGPDEESSGGRG
jgi:hypothetical protein